MDDDRIIGLGLCLAPAAVPFATLIRPDRRRAVAAILFVGVVSLVIMFALNTHFRNEVLDDLSPGLAVAAFYGMASSVLGQHLHRAIQFICTLAMAFVGCANILVLTFFATGWLLSAPEPATLEDLSPGFVCKHGRWAIIGDGGSWATLYEVLPYAPFLMRDVASGIAPDGDGGFGCADALAEFRKRHPIT